MPATDFDDIELLDDPESDQHVRLNKTDVERMRKAAKESSGLRKELDKINRQSAITTAGLTDLNGDQREALATLVEDATPENLRAKAEALGWVQKVEDPEKVPDAELQAHGDAAQAGAGAAAPASAVAKPEDVAAWPVDKRLRFQNAHPDLHENLLRGEQIAVPAAFL